MEENITGNVFLLNINLSEKRYFRLILLNTKLNLIVYKIIVHVFKFYSFVL